MICILGLMTSPFSAFSKVYFVSKNGNDSNAGTSIQLAWAGLSRINVFGFLPGDSILLCGTDTFKGSIYFPSTITGTFQKPIYLGSYGSGKAQILSGNNSGFYAYNNHCITIENIVFRGSGIALNNGIGVCFYMDLLQNARLYNIVLNRVEVYGYKTAGISIGCYTSDQSRSGYSNVKIENCIAAENGHSGISVWGLFKTSDTMYSHSNVKIRNSIAHHNYGISGHTNHSGNGIIVGQTDTCLMEYCEAYENGINNTFASAGPAGIWAWDSKFVTIQYCYAHHNRTQTKDGDGFDLDGGVRNSIMQYNYACNNDGPGFLVAQFTGARPMKNIVVRYNISEKDGKGLGALIWSGDPGGIVTAEKIDVYNNTIYSDTISDPNTNAVMAVYNNFGAMKNVRICNNIFISKNQVRLTDFDKTINLKCYNNAYFDCGDGFRFKDQGQVYTNLGAWRNASKQEIYNGKNVGYRIDPGLIGAGNAGTIANVDSLTSIYPYRLKNHSALINKGILIDSLLYFASARYDFFRDSIDKSVQYSIGASEIRTVRAGFTYLRPCKTNTLVFTNTSQNGLSYLWKFGDGSISTLKHPKHTFDTAGVYFVKLYVYGPFAYMDSIEQMLTIHPRPVAAFATSNVCQGDSCILVNQSQNAFNFFWSTDDTVLRRETNLKHVYKDPGTKVVQLIVQDVNGCLDTSRQLIAIYAKPKAVFQSGSICVNDTLKLFTVEPGVQRRWYSDGLLGSSDSVFQIIGTGAKHVRITLVLETGNKCLDSSSAQIQVYPNPELPVLLKNHCLNSPLPIEWVRTEDLNYHWQFGDGNTAAEAMPKHTFSNPGNYTVTLSGEDSNGCKAFLSRYISVYNLPNARFSSRQIGLYMQLNAQDSTYPVYIWTINGQTQSETRSYIQIPVADVKHKPVQLFVADSMFCADTFSQTINPVLNTDHSLQAGANTVRVFPNPFSHKMQIILPEAANLTLMLFSIHGELMYRFEPLSSEFEWDNRLFPLSNGLYFLVAVQNGFNVQSLLIVKQ